MAVKWILFVSSLVAMSDQLLAREVELLKDWTLTNENGSIHCTGLEMPSGIYSALSHYTSCTGLPAYQYDKDEILKSYNDVNLRWMSYDNWTYATKFKSPEKYLKRTFVNLTFHGIDTIATIKLNNEIIGHTDNMFIRYSFNVKHLLKDDMNDLEVIFTSPVHEAKRLASLYPKTPPECPNVRYHGECHMNFLRKMQASFSWDWGLAAPSMGIWRRVTLEIHDVAIIRDVDVAISMDKENDLWVMDIKVYLETGLKVPFNGELTLNVVDLLYEPVKKIFENVNPDNPVLEFQQVIPASAVEVWWPNGYGEQKLYHLYFTWNGYLDTDYQSDLLVSHKAIRVGFRTIELIQKEIENGTSFFFRVNGVDIFMKGSNWIPSHILPERTADQDRVKHLLKSAKEAHMNMLRVWGGGVYESDFFYDMADYYGILIWQDMMFACAMYPVYPEFLQSVEEETVQNAKRIAHHPSVAIFVTNNENEAALSGNWYGTLSDFDTFAANYRQLYVGTIYHALKIISHPSRPDALISSPSNGDKGKEENFISKNPQDARYGDMHYYNVIFDSWDPNIYPKPRFASEYGFQSLPSLTSWKRILNSVDDLNDLIDHRQHFPEGNAPIILLIKKHFNLPSEKDAKYMEALIYLSQISQAMVTKTETEVYRSQRSTPHNTMGALYWQLNDVWVAPSWSSIDYFGNYKILQYWAIDFLAPQTIISHVDSTSKVNIYAVRDTIDPGRPLLKITMKTHLWSNLFEQSTSSWTFISEPNSVQLVNSTDLYSLFSKSFTKQNSFFEFELSKGSTILSTTYLFPEKFQNVEGIMDPEIKIDITSNKCQAPLHSISISVEVKRPAVFVYLELTRRDIQFYKFSKNGFMQLIPIQTIYLEFNDDFCKQITKSDIKVLTVNEFI